MKSVGIICEYNPFHNGHIYHLKKIKEMFPDYNIILVMSGNFLQRGEASLINKWDKTKIALEYGIDLVIELPFVFASQGADIFSKGSIEILNHLNVSYLIFGSECGNIDTIKNLANISINNKEYDLLVKKYLDKGINYPSSLSKALETLSNYKIETPNDLLGLAYIKEIIKQKSNIIPVCIKRTNDYHCIKLNNKITSASSIRNALKKNKNIKKYVPSITYKYLKGNLHFIDNYYDILKYKILTCKDLSIYQTVDEGIGSRIKKFIVCSNSLEELINNIKTKRYTYNKISRMLTHILCDFTKDEAKKCNSIKYIRVLGFNKNGKEYLNSIKKEIRIPIITNFTNNDMLDIELRATCVYDTKLIELEYKNKPIIKNL